MRKNYLTLFLLLSWIALFGQAAPRPRIGLALSGGGAKGFAHIGVLKVLEEAGIRPDYITGTSMGSIIGGLYAIGYSAEELHQLVAGQDWDNVISDRIPLSEVIFEEKMFFKNEFLELGIEKGKIKAPSGAIHGQQIEQLLSELSLRVFDKRSFDEFPIPYRCVGVDVIKGEVVEFSEGYLPDVMRISMAIPSVFTAIRQDSMVLIDGGLIRNFPVQEVEQMGADIIIGVYVGAEQNTYENTQSFSDILYQTGFLYSIKDHYDQLPMVDYYVEPKLQDYSAADFKQYDSLIYQGELAARAILPELKILADSLQNFAAKPIRPIPKIPDSIYIHTVLIEGNKNVSKQEIRAHTNPLIGAYATPKDLQNTLSSLYGTDLFDKVSYELFRDGELNVLKIRCNEKELNLLSTSLVYDSYNNAGFLFGLTTRNTVTAASRLMFIGEISDNYSARLSLLKYLGKSRSSSLFAEFGILKNEIPIYDNGSLTNQYRIVEWPLRIQWQKRLKKNSQLSIGLRNNILNSSPIAGEDTRIFDDARYRSTSSFIGFNHNSLDRNVFPTRGAHMEIEAAFIFDDHFRFDSISNQGIVPTPGQRTGTYQKYTFQLESFIPLNDHSSLKVNPFAGIVVNARNNFADFYLLGGPTRTTQRSLPFLGIDPNELPVETTAGLSLGYQYFLNSNWILSLDANAAYIATPSTLTATNSESAFLAGMGATLGYRTIVGPVQFTVMYPFDTDQLVRRQLRTFLTFGYRF